VGKSDGVFHVKDLHVAWTSERNPTTSKGDKLRAAGLHELIEAPDHMISRKVIKLPRFCYKNHNQGPTTHQTWCSPLTCTTKPSELSAGFVGYRLGTGTRHHTYLALLLNDRALPISSNANEANEELAEEQEREIQHRSRDQDEDQNQLLRVQEQLQRSQTRIARTQRGTWKMSRNMNRAVRRLYLRSPQFGIQARQEITAIMKM